MTHVLHLTVLVLLATTTQSACVARGTTTSLPAVRVGIIDWPGFYPIFLAEQLGYFRAEEVPVEIKLFVDNPTMNRAFEAGELDALCGVYSDFILMAARGVPLRMASVLDWSNADVIVAKPQFASMAALHGQVVAFESPNSFSHLFVLAMLERAGVGEPEVRFKLVPFHRVLAELEAGHIAAGHTWEPYTSQALAKGYRVVGRAGDIPGIIADSLAFSSALVDGRRPQVVALLRALVRAQREHLSNPDASFARLAPLLGRPAAELQAFTDQVQLLTPEQSVAAFDERPDDTSLYGAGRRTLAFVAKHGKLPRPLPLASLLDGNLLRSALQHRNGSVP